MMYDLWKLRYLPAHPTRWPWRPIPVPSSNTAGSGTDGLVLHLLCISLKCDIDYLIFVFFSPWFSKSFVSHIMVCVHHSAWYLSFDIPKNCTGLKNGNRTLLSGISEHPSWPANLLVPMKGLPQLFNLSFWVCSLHYFLLLEVIPISPHSLVCGFTFRRCRSAWTARHGFQTELWEAQAAVTPALRFIVWVR